MHNNTRAAIGLAVLIASGIVTGCVDGRIGNNYGPDFMYLDHKQITNTMARLSVDVWRINDILESAETIAGYRREEIIGLLKDMEEAANVLGAGTRQTNHLLIDNNIDQFKSDVRAARKAVENEPPNYYMAGKVSGSCLACHVLR